MTAESITCPDCGATSHNPNDIREGYCGRCHGWTTKRSLNDDPVFDAWVDWFIREHGTPPNIGDIMMFFEARASVKLDKGDGETHRV